MLHYYLVMYEKLFNTSGLSLDRLRALVEVADAGGISRAVSEPARQSQYSRQLKELESFFGVELTRRDGKKLSLTIAGNQLVALVREQFRGLEGFIDSAHGASTGFAIGAGDSLIQWLLLPRLGLLEKALPAFRLNLFNRRSDEIIRDLREMKLDFGLVRNDALKAGLQSVAVFKMEFALFIPKTLLPRLPDNPDVMKLMGKLPLAITEAGAFSKRVLDLVTRKKGALQPVLQCDSHPTIAAAVATGRYAAILPIIAMSTLSEDANHCIQAPKTFSPLMRPISLVWNPRLDRINSRADRFRKALLQHLKA